ncbi:hypothetical protein PGTUg99_005940 [Puccinia graminis f. sp. tritici]|uniref:Uncharacterized protein n=1 Tax=Puccinia graminis f. sp. tritici TaxID=56615 RepID=A0A5B0SHB1_PUCGR|nr:hypothetical protein PGTUg99_005940 [Puccinia graminis f. sp. tritici]
MENHTTNLVAQVRQIEEDRSNQASSRNKMELLIMARMNSGSSFNYNSCFSSRLTVEFERTNSLNPLKPQLCHPSKYPNPTQ